MKNKFLKTLPRISSFKYNVSLPGRLCFQIRPFFIVDLSLLCASFLSQVLPMWLEGRYYLNCKLTGKEFILKSLSEMWGRDRLVEISYFAKDEVEKVGSYIKTIQFCKTFYFSEVLFYIHNSNSNNDTLKATVDNCDFFLGYFLHLGRSKIYKYYQNKIKHKIGD